MTGGELRASQRRMAVLAVASSLLLLAGAAVGADHAIAHVAPAVGLFALLLLGCYPGAGAYERALRRRSPLSPPRSRSAACPRPSLRLALPRGGALLAYALAGRAPPLPP